MFLALMRFSPGSWTRWIILRVGIARFGIVTAFSMTMVTMVTMIAMAATMFMLVVARLSPGTGRTATGIAGCIGRWTTIASFRTITMTAMSPMSACYTPRPWFRGRTAHAPSFSVVVFSAIIHILMVMCLFFMTSFSVSRTTRSVYKSKTNVSLVVSMLWEYVVNYLPLLEQWCPLLVLL